MAELGILFLISFASVALLAGISRLFAGLILRRPDDYYGIVLEPGDSRAYQDARYGSAAQAPGDGRTYQDAGYGNADQAPRDECVDHEMDDGRGDDLPGADQAEPDAKRGTEKPDTGSAAEKLGLKPGVVNAGEKPGSAISGEKTGSAMSSEKPGSDKHGTRSGAAKLAPKSGAAGLKLNLGLGSSELDPKSGAADVKLGLGPGSGEPDLKAVQAKPVKFAIYPSSQYFYEDPDIDNVADEYYDSYVPPENDPYKDIRRSLEEAYAAAQEKLSARK